MSIVNIKTDVSLICYWLNGVYECTFKSEIQRNSTFCTPSQTSIDWRFRQWLTLVLHN